MSAAPCRLALRSLLLVGIAVVSSGCVTSHVETDEDFAATYAPPILQQPRPDASIYNTGGQLALFEDGKARRVGDILVVLLTEQTSGQKSSDTSIGKNNSTTISDPTLAGRTGVIGGGRTLDFGLNSSQEFSGEADSVQSNRLSGSIAVTVADVLPGGNLQVQGEKWIQINKGKEYIRLKGIVRTRDISADNTIRSTQIADARISYSAKGAAADANTVGWLSRFFLSPIWPF